MENCFLLAVALGISAQVGPHHVMEQSRLLMSVLFWFKQVQRDLIYLVGLVKFW